MNSLSPTNRPADTPTEIVECVKTCMEAKGLERTQDYFDSMELLLSRLPWWGEVKAAVEPLFANERKRLEQLELARARASAPNIYQVLPAAQAGIGSVDHIDQMAMGDGATLNHQLNNKQ